MTTRKQYTFRRWTITYHLSEADFSDLLDFRDAMRNADERLRDTINATVFETISPAFNFDCGKYASWVFQIEECPATERLHVQGYASFKDAISMTAVKKILNMPGVHLEAAQSDAQTNYKYCTKKDTRVFGPWAQGNFGGPGHRTDLDALYSMAEQHATGKEMLQQLGAAGMRHLYLYQRTTRVLLDDDESDKKIIAAREARAKAVSEAAARHKPRRVDDDDDDDDYMEREPTYDDPEGGGFFDTQ